MSSLLRFHCQLQLNHIPRTWQRDLIFKAIAQWRPITTVELINQLSSRIGRATVYRAVAQFVRADIIIRTSSGALDLSDRVAQHHHIRACRGCDRRTGFWDEGLEKALMRYAKHSGFAVEDHVIELFGLCHQCRQQTSPRTPIDTRLRRLPQRVIMGQ